MPRADTIVVGCGLVGAAVARRLIEKGQRVVLVERGTSVDGDREGAHLRNRTDLRDDPDGFFAAIDEYFDYIDTDAPPEGLPGAFLTSVFGGMSVAWTNNCPRSVHGVDRPGLVEPAEWDRYHDLAEEFLGVRLDDFDDSHRRREVAARLSGPLAEQGRETIRLPLSGHRVGPTSIRYMGPADVLRSVVDDLEVVAGTADTVVVEGDVATGVRVDGTVHEADAVVVAAGAIETPLMLYRSGLRHRALGRYLSYHPVLIAQVVLDDDLCAAGPEPDPLPRLGIPPTAARPWFVMVLRDTNPLPPDPDDSDVAPNRLIEIQAFAPVDPHLDNYLHLNHLSLSHSSPRFHVPLRSDDIERRRAVEGDVTELAGRIGRFRRGCEPQWAPLGTPHLMGSYRMGPTDDGTSVVDTAGRVWGTTNLHLAGNGVIPSRLAVNPTLTTIALAVRTADRLAAAGGRAGEFS